MDIKKIGGEYSMKISYNKYNIIISLILIVILVTQIILKKFNVPGFDFLIWCFVFLVAFDFGVFFRHYNIIGE